MCAATPPFGLGFAGLVFGSSCMSTPNKTSDVTTPATLPSTLTLNNNANNVPTQRGPSGGFGTSQEGGYAISYLINEDNIYFHVCYRKKEGVCVFVRVRVRVRACVHMRACMRGQPSQTVSASVHACPTSWRMPVCWHDIVACLSSPSYSINSARHKRAHDITNS
jgi:hypothetical protein